LLLVSIHDEIDYSTYKLRMSTSLNVAAAAGAASVPDAAASAAEPALSVMVAAAEAEDVAEADSMDMELIS
jgi:hypothetical protein